MKGVAFRVGEPTFEIEGFAIFLADSPSGSEASTSGPEGSLYGRRTRPRPRRIRIFSGGLAFRFERFAFRVGGLDLAVEGFAILSADSPFGSEGSPLRSEDTTSQSKDSHFSRRTRL